MRDWRSVSLGEARKQCALTRVIQMPRANQPGVAQQSAANVFKAVLFGVFYESMSSEPEISC